MSGNPPTIFFQAQKKACSSRPVLGNALKNIAIKSTALATTLLLLISSPTVFAQSSTNNEAAKGFTGNTNLEVRHDDNIRRTTSDNEQSDTLVRR